ncbi:type III secretion system inner rod subunit SctI [Winslowiella iniecta]|uniref:Type III secretion system protein PrgJ n=1 Tax=Winslowiella iniecta TaxID=1560201 RepID=A0A0L7T8B1_9GAMM|nr:type III secretion system inner rod subunit SctI [Winslowiella iniecta]KOC91613.1 hypothetical protein NG42_05080 [Winslowiella iniecta]KOC94436.1 hypothetical protein NG43_04425 [Winslowiella iniecta]
MLTISLENAGQAQEMGNDVETGSLEGLLRQAYIHHVAAEYQDKMAVLASANDPVKATDIDEIYQYQLKTSEYGIKLSLYSIMTRKAVTAVDTLIRA